MTNKVVSIGADIGHSSVKVSVACPTVFSGARTAKFETVVMNWFQISNPETARLAEVDTVSIANQKFFIGKTALLQSQAEDFSGQDRDWTETKQHDALIMGAWQRAQTILAENDVLFPEKIVFVLGLPASSLKSHKQGLIDRAHKMISPRLGPNQILEVLVQSQSAAPLYELAIDANGNETGVVSDDDSYGVVEIGHFTTDFMFQDRGAEIEHASSSVPGVTMIYERVKNSLKQAGYIHDIETLFKAVSTKSITVYGKPVPVNNIVDPAITQFSNTICDEVNRRFGSAAQRMSGIVLAGGGAEIQEISTVISARYPNAAIPSNPRYSVSNGLCRFGLMAAA